MVETYGEAAISERTCCQWFQCYKMGDFSVEDKECPGQVKKFEDAEEPLQSGETITGARYRTQLMRLSRALKQKRPQYEERHDKVILLHDNARPHVAQVVKTYLETLKWDILPHPLYSPDIAPSGYHLLRSMTHGLVRQHLRSYEKAKNWVDSWIDSKDEQFFRGGIRMLPERSEKVVASDGQYFEE